jgi:hypothetical protein
MKTLLTFEALLIILQQYAGKENDLKQSVSFV